VALLKPSTKADKTQIRINIDSTLVDRVKSYCDFAGIKKIDEFFEKASEFVMKKDRDWKKYDKSPEMGTSSD